MAYNSISYTATGTNYKFRNPYYITTPASHIKVYLNGAEQTITTHYTWIETDWGVEFVTVPSEDDVIKIEDIEHEVTTAVDSDSTLAECIAGVGANVSLIETNIADIETSETDITNLQANNTSRVADIAANTALISTNTGNVSTNASGIATNVSDISTNVANISTNTVDIAALSDQATAVAALQAQDTADALLIAANTTNITSNDVDINTLVGRMNSLEIQIGIHANESRGDLDNNASATQLVAGSDLSGTWGNCSIAGTAADSAYIIFEVTRETDSGTRVTKVICDAIYINSVWYLGTRSETVLLGDLSGVTFTIQTDSEERGNVYYATDNMAGTNYSGKVRWQMFNMRNNY